LSSLSVACAACADLVQPARFANALQVTHFALTALRIAETLLARGVDCCCTCLRFVLNNLITAKQLHRPSNNGSASKLDARRIKAKSAWISVINANTQADTVALRCDCACIVVVTSGVGGLRLVVANAIKTACSKAFSLGTNGSCDAFSGCWIANILHARVRVCCASLWQIA